MQNAVRGKLIPKHLRSDNYDKLQDHGGAPAVWRHGGRGCKCLGMSLRYAGFCIVPLVLYLTKCLIMAILVDVWLS